MIWNIIFLLLIIMLIIAVAIAIAYGMGRRGLEPYHNATSIKECFDTMMWGDSNWQYGYVNVTNLKDCFRD